MFCIAILYGGNEGQRSYAKLNFQTQVKSAVVIDTAYHNYIHRAQFAGSFNHDRAIFLALYTSAYYGGPGGHASIQ